MQLEVDSELKMRVVTGGPSPLVYVPMVDFGKLDDPSIIDSF